MTALRSVLFNFLLIFGSLFWSIVLFWTWFFPPHTCAALIGQIYGGYITLIEKCVLGLKLEVRGMEHLPKDGKFIIAAKHQSAFETLKLPFMKSLGYPVIVLKKELTRLPFWGFYPRRMGLIPIDRATGTKALSEMADGCRKALQDGRPVAIFPQGTRVRHGDTLPYKAGLAKLYKDLQVPIVPMALNSGVFWGKNSFFKKSGTVTFEFLPLLPAGMPPLKMMEQLETQLETASDRLAEETKKAIS